MRDSWEAPCFIAVVVAGVALLFGACYWVRQGPKLCADCQVSSPEPQAVRCWECGDELEDD